MKDDTVRLLDFYSSLFPTSVLSFAFLCKWANIPLFLNDLSSQNIILRNRS